MLESYKWMDGWMDGSLTAPILRAPAVLIIGMVGVQIEHLTVSWNERDKRSERQSQSELSL